jgi:hypothetical protein
MEYCWAMFSHTHAWHSGSDTAAACALDSAREKLTEDHNDLSLGMAEASVCNTRRVASHRKAARVRDNEVSWLLLPDLSSAAETAGGVARMIASNTSQSLQAWICKAGLESSRPLLSRTAATAVEQRISDTFFESAATT